MVTGANFHGVTISAPDFSQPPFTAFPEARFVPAPMDGVLPDGFFSTTNLPTYVRIADSWRMPREPRMDAALVLDDNGDLWVREPRRVKKGDRIAVGEAENGTQGIYVDVAGFLGDRGDDGEFKFMASEVSREKPTDYALMALQHIRVHNPG